MLPSKAVCHSAASSCLCALFLIMVILVSAALSGCVGICRIDGLVKESSQDIAHAGSGKDKPSLRITFQIGMCRELTLERVVDDVRIVGNRTITSYHHEWRMLSDFIDMEASIARDMARIFQGKGYETSQGAAVAYYGSTEAPSTAIQPQYIWNTPGDGEGRCKNKITRLVGACDFLEFNDCDCDALSRSTCQHSSTDVCVYMNASQDENEPSKLQNALFVLTLFCWPIADTTENNLDVTVWNHRTGKMTKKRYRIVPKRYLSTLLLPTFGLLNFSGAINPDRENWKVKRYFASSIENLIRQELEAAEKVAK
jgi:hypothetical protein